MNKKLSLKLTLFSLTYITVLIFDYLRHEYLSRTSFKNYSWLSYFIYNSKGDFKYSLDVIISFILFVFVIFSFIRNRVFNNWIFIIFPIIFIILHIISLL